MRSLLVLCLFVAGSYSVKLEHDGDIYDILDIKEIVVTDDLRKEAYACLMDLGPCSEKYQIIRDVIPRILKTKCGDCNASQKAIYEYNAEYLKKYHNDLYNKMLERYAQ
ncbi:allergen Tha p 1 [Manduca sexta]|uniref:Uncharacterized protein n=1 Tax=Manduca sexta TaxID=7130 RepID=A0A921ZBK4_MANSE|nr:allergen Tha p 1 [Manduca sexta]KAG6454406.1 hypothetical protein O3G_MSEX008668 [Manduca sexta]KAG6454407.1 hypothetical protein O3G_MSEX008668 [Manduca sexta]KAG6454408.1 hypothetical protein O3G_MSEX008668 [Manduca sexta]